MVNVLQRGRKGQNPAHLTIWDSEPKVRDANIVMAVDDNNGFEYTNKVYYFPSAQKYFY